MAERRVVITGIGALTPVGKTAPEFWNGLVSGKSGVRPITHFDTEDLPTKFAGQIETTYLLGGFKKIRFKIFQRYI